MLAHHPIVMDELLAEDAGGSADAVELREVLQYLATNDIAGAPQAITDEVFRLASRLPSTLLGSDDEPLSLLAAARERLAADVRRGMLPAAPRVSVVEATEDRNTLPVPPTSERRQLTLPSMQTAARDLIGPAAWLQVFDHLGGNYMAQGRGAPMPLPGFSPSARRRLIFGPDETAGTRATVRSRQRDAERAFKTLHAVGVIDLETDHHDPRIYRPRRLDID